MPRTLDPVLRELHERANPRTEIIVEVGVPDVGQVIRRSTDQFFGTPPLVAGSIAPVNTLAASPGGALQLAATSNRIAQQEASDNATDIRPFPPNKHLKGLGWRVADGFDRATIRQFHARLERRRVGGIGPFANSKLRLQIWRAVGVPGRLRFENGTTQQRTEWNFTEMLNPPLIIPAPNTWGEVAGNSEFTWVTFDLANYGLVLENSPPRGPTDVAIEENIYYFELTAIDIPENVDNWILWRQNTGVTNVAGVGEFRRMWWDRPNPDTDPWVKTPANATYAFRLDVDSYNPGAPGYAEAKYLIDLGRAPAAGTTGRIVFERGVPPGTVATLEISTAGSGGPYTVVAHGDVVALAQQTYHLRVRLYPSASFRATPSLWGWGLEFRTVLDVSLDVKPPSMLSHEVGVPFLAASLADGLISVLRTGLRDFGDKATKIGSQYAPSSLEVDIFLGSRHPACGREKWFLIDRASVSMRDPTELGEGLTLLSYGKRAKRKVPTPIETINTVHVVVAVPAPSTTAVVLTTNLLGAAVGAGTEYDNKGYYLRVRKSSQEGLPVGYTHVIAGSSVGTAISPAQNQLDFTGNALPGTFAAGDEIEIHSGVYTQPALTWRDADPADIWLEILTSHLAIPIERIGRADLGGAARGGFPPHVTDIAPGDLTTQNMRKVTTRLDQAEDGWDLLQELSFIMGGTTTVIGGQIVFRQVYPLRDAAGIVTVSPGPVVAVFTPKEFLNIETPTGLEDRTTVVKCKYGVNYTAANPDAYPQREAVFVDSDALAWHTQQDLEAVGTSEVPDEITRWLYNTEDQGFFLASACAWQVAMSGSTGLRVWGVPLATARPDLTIGDPIAVVTDEYTDYDPSTKTPIKGWNGYRLVIVNEAGGGKHFRGYMLGLHSSIFDIRGGPGTLSGPYAPIDMPEDFTVTVEVQQTPQGGVLQLKSTVTAPDTPFLQEFDLQIRTRPLGTVNWGAPGSQRMGRDGLAHTKADYNAEYEVTARAVSTGGNTLGVPQTRIVSTGLPPAASPLIGTAIREPTRIRWPLTWDANGKRMEQWYKLDSADPGVLISQWKVGTKSPVEYHRDDGRAEAEQAIPGSTWWATVSFVFFNAWDDLNASGVVTVKAQGAAPVPPPDIAVLALDSPAYPTATEIRLLATMPGDVTDVTGIMLYRDGSAYQGPIPRTAGAGAQQAILVSGLNPGATHQWKVKAVDADAIESANFSNTVEATHPGGTLDTPSISLSGYSIPSQGFTIYVTPGANNPPGTLYQGYHAIESDPFTIIEATIGSSIFHREPQGPVPQTDHVKVKASKSEWTPSGFSNTESRVIPKTLGEPPE